MYYYFKEDYRKIIFSLFSFDFNLHRWPRHVSKVRLALSKQDSEQNIQHTCTVYIYSVHYRGSLPKNFFLLPPFSLLFVLSALSPYTHIHTPDIFIVIGMLVTYKHTLYPHLFLYIRVQRAQANSKTTPGR